MVKEGRKAELWADVTSEMTSEEEKVGEMYVRHPTSYRSQSLDRVYFKDRYPSGFRQEQIQTSSSKA